MLISLLAIGFLLGLKHALDADHIAAVASLAARSASIRETMRVAAAWGFGHAVTLVVFGSVLVLVGGALPHEVATLLEGVVGLMLIILGIGVLRRARESGIHIHAHTHDHGDPHVHLHVHHEDRERHDHPHPKGLVPRAIIIGCVHGLAGTAGLVLLALPTMQSSSRAMIYLAIFGTGTVLGMIGFSLLISVPLTMTARRMRRGLLALELLLGTANVALGLFIALESVNEILAR